MTPAEATQLCAFIAARCPQQRFEESTPEAWYPDLRAIAFSDAVEAARFCSAARPFVALSELLDAVRSLRNERAMRAALPVAAPAPEARRRGHLATIREDIERIAQQRRGGST